VTMTLRTLALVATIVALLLVASAPASAETFIAYGTGLTRCDINLAKSQRGPLLPQWHYYGKTDCTVPITQTGEAILPGAAYGGMCSTFATHCFSGDPPENDGYGWIEGFAPSSTLHYYVTLRAPDGQGWLGAPLFCSGVGTDNLQCDFTSTVGGYLSALGA